MQHLQHTHSLPAERAQRGVILIIALILLVVVSLVASLSIRNATSSEAVSSSARTSALAYQSAEVALRYCETSLVNIVTSTGTFTTTFTSSNILTYTTPVRWTNTALWDSTTTNVFVLPASSVNQSGISTTFSRPPECMVENLPVAVAGTATFSTTRSYVITARGFGPEVPAANASRSRPIGSEVWLQSIIELE